MSEVDASQLGQSQNEIKSEENAPINVKVCFRFREGFLVVVVFLASSMLTVPSYPSHARTRKQVVSSTGDEVFFKIKRNTKLSKLQGAYAGKVGKDVSSIRCAFLFPSPLRTFLSSSFGLRERR